MNESNSTIEQITDPKEIARARAQDERQKRNGDWLQAHWDEVIPQARGRFLAVAAQEAHVAETPEEGWAWASASHPEDDGACVQYVPLEGAPRIYGHCGRVVSL